MAKARDPQHQQIVISLGENSFWWNDLAHQLRRSLRPPAAPYKPDAAAVGSGHPGFDGANGLTRRHLPIDRNHHIARAKPSAFGGAIRSHLNHAHDPALPLQYQAKPCTALALRLVLHCGGRRDVA